MSHETETFNLNEMNSSFNTNPYFDPYENRLGELKNAEESLTEERTNDLYNNYDDLNHISKRNAYARHGKGKRKQLIKHKNPSEVKFTRVHPVRRKSKEGQSKIKLNNKKKYEYQGTSLYENNKSPFKDNKSKFISKYGVDNSFSVLDRANKIKIDEDSTKKLLNDSHEGEDGSYKGNNVINSARDNKDNNIDICENEQIDKEYGGRKSDQQFQNEKSNSEDSHENTKKEYGHKIKQTNLSKLTRIADQNVKKSDNDEFGEDKSFNFVRKGEKLKNNDYISEKYDVLQSKGSLEKISSVDSFEEKSNNKNYSKSDKENINTSNLEQTKHKMNHNQAQSNGKNYTSNDISFRIRNYDLKNSKLRKRSQKKAPSKTRQAPMHNSEREYHGNKNRETPINDPDLYFKEDINTLEHTIDLSEDTENKRNQRDIKKRLRKHNNYKNQMVQDGNILSYPKNSDENEDSNVRKVEKDEDSDNAKYDDIEQQYRKVDVNSNNNDKYSYKESFEEETGAMHDEDNTNNKYNRKKTFSRQSQEPRQKGDSKEKCVEYKAEKVTKKTTTCTSGSTSEKCTTKGTTCAPKRTTCKTKSTPSTCNKPLTTKNIESESGRNTSKGDELDIFEKYLSGQLADDFIDAVMSKIKRSRKIYKELGFQNDSEETCDRCIETKPNKMPDKETLKTSMGKCLKNNEHKSNCFTCYSVPRPMEKVLNLLVLFEKEHENSVYSKIRDDSSFIFTGDYPEQFHQNENGAVNKNKYTSDRDSFSKDTFDKQDLREDSNEEKQDDQVANRNALEDEYTTSEAENKPEEYSTEAEVAGNENVDQISDSKLNVQSGFKNRGLNNNKSPRKISSALEKTVEENDYNDEFDMSVVPKSKYSSLMEPDAEKPNDSSDKGSIKQRRKAFKSDKLRGPESPYMTPKDVENPEVKSMKVHNVGEQNFGFNANKPSADYDYENKHVVPMEHDDKTYENIKQRHQTPYHYDGRSAHSGNSKLSPFSYKTNEKFSHKRNHFGYPSEDFNELQRSQNNGHAVANGFMSTGWDGNEYQLIPKQAGREAADHNMISSVPRKRYYNNDYEELNMVKRESEPSYEDEPLFFEVPNIEYDLY